VTQSYPFIFGAQYYRAPTPQPECWEADLRRMRSLGFNSVKYWVQWRWAHRSNDQFLFDDLDRLMDLADENQLQVTLNTIFDVSPHWLFEKYPDARQIMNNGQVVEPYTVAHRQIGGHPGPCYNHPGARAERQKFLTASVEHFRTHPALAMWDVWNEPELCFPQRSASVPTLVCYCPHCRRGFMDWLKVKYDSLDRLNQIWGRCYETWAQVELPRNPHTFTDFVDWREFHVDTMSREANWRLALVKQLDPPRVHYLHVVPNTMSVFNAVSCATDDFDLAANCDVFAATMSGGPIFTTQVLSAGRGKVCYNVESHINFGMTYMHPRILELPDLLKDFLPQIGLGIKGFLFWQYRPEVRGAESPAWGLVALDGSDRPITRAVAAFWQTISPLSEALLQAHPLPAEVGIWKSRKNEIFHFAIHNTFDALVESVEAYAQACYGLNFRTRFISGERLSRSELEGIKLLILPSPYYLTQAEAQVLIDWVESGGVVLNEAHLAGYNATTGRHNRRVPGAGLAEAFGLHEVDSTSSYHLKLATAEAFLGAATEDVKKALADFGSSGGKYFPIRLSNGSLAWGAERYAVLAGENCTVEGAFEAGSACLVSKRVGKGKVYYCGTNLGQGAQKDPAGLIELLLKAASTAGVGPTLNASGASQVHVDALFNQDALQFLVLKNQAKDEQTVRLEKHGKAHGLFSGMDIDLARPVNLPGEFIDLFVVY
jgi:beta-galactosidase